MIIDVLSAVVLSASGIAIIAYLNKIANKISEATIKKKEIVKEYTSLKEESFYNAEIQRILIKLKLDHNASKVVLAQFHNGGNFANGMDMKKFTVSHETCGGTNFQLMDKNVGVLNSKYGIAFEHLAIQGEYCVYDTKSCDDDNYRNDMVYYGIESSYLFMIRGLDDKDIGFIGVNFKYGKVLMEHDKDKIREQIPRIISLLVMKKYEK